MKKIFLIFIPSFLFFLFLFFSSLSFLPNTAMAACTDSNAVCIVKGCGTEYTASGGTCKSTNNSDGKCCTKNSAETGGGGGGGTGTDFGKWGTPGDGVSLDSIKSFFTSEQAGGVQQKGYQAILGWIINLLILAAIILSLLYLIWGGFDWITSQGDKQKLASAKHKITFAIIGLVIVFLSFFIINIVTNFFGKPNSSPPVFVPCSSGACMSADLCESNGGYRLASCGFGGQSVCCSK